MGNFVYLVQTDTTVGFLSEDKIRLENVKSRQLNKSFIRVVQSLKSLPYRVPKEFKKRVRRAKKTTFVYSKEAIRVVKDERHRRFLKKFETLYSTSANRSGEKFDLEFALLKSDIIVYEKAPFSEEGASKIFRLGKSKLKRLR